MKSQGCMISCVRDTVLLTGLMIGLGMLSFAAAAKMSQADWIMLALPAGACLGLLIGTRFPSHLCQRLLSAAGLLLFAISIMQLATPVEIPESIPPGWDRLPYGLSEMIRPFLLTTLVITGVGCFLVASITTMIRSRLNRSA